MSRRGNNATRSEPSAPKLQVPSDSRKRALAKFTNMRGRAVSLSLVPTGPTFDAKTPEELNEKFDEWIVALITKQTPS